MEQLGTVNAPLRAPRGFHAAKVDSAGRLKLPAKYQEYLRLLPERSLFVTLYGDMARIYTNGAFEANLAKLGADPQRKSRIAKYADMFGSDVDLDPQGRITLPQSLRKKLDLTDKAVQLRFFEDVITVHPQDRFEVEAADLEATIGDDLSWAGSQGFNL